MRMQYKRTMQSHRPFILHTGNSPCVSLYYYTAGEIEARDVSARADLVAEQRKNTRPDVDQKDVVFADGGESNSDEKSERITEWSIRSALYDALEKGDSGDENLISLGTMPQYIQSKLGIQGELYVFRNHIYENMVSEEQANADGRNPGKGEHFHALGEETLVSAILALEKPSVVIADKMKNGNPEISMILPVFGPNDLPIHAAVSFYKNEPINGKYDKKPHVAVTFYEHPYNDFKNDRGDIRDGLITAIEKARKENRLLDVSKEIRADLPVIAENPALGNIAKSTLNNSIAEFKKKVNEFKEKHKIRYSFADDGTQGEVEDFLNEQDANAAEDEFLLKMLHYQENPDEATDLILENELGGKENFIDRAIHTKTDEALRREAEKAAKGKARREIVTKRIAKEYAKSVSWFQRKFVDSGHAVTQIGKQIKDSRLYAYYNAARASTNAAVYMLTGAQTDINGKKVGEGLNAIFAPIKEKGEA